jgi:hypothetical protein
LALIENSGKLEELALPDLLTSICASGETGVLRLTRHGIAKMIYIQEGRIVFATSTDPDDRLGELLLRKGLLSIQHVEEASVRLSERKRLGTLLVEMGYLKAEELVRAVVEQVKEIVFDLFRWYDGEYLFMKGALPSREVITLRLSTAEVILGGIQRIDRWSRVVRGLGGLESRFHSVVGGGKTARQMQLREEHAALLEAMKKPISVRDLCRLSIMNDFELCRTLWAFRVIGLVEPAIAFATDPRQILEAALRSETPDEPASAMTATFAAMTAASATASPAAVDDDEDAPVLELAEEPPPAVSPPAASELAEPEVDAAVAAFNDRHRRLVSLLKSNGGPRADDIVKRSLAMIGKDLPGLFEGLSPEADGSFNPEALKTNIFAFGVVGYQTGFEMLIERELERAGSLLGPSIRRQISSQLKTAPV